MSYIRGDYYSWVGGTDESEFIHIASPTIECRDCGDVRCHKPDHYLTWLVMPMEVFDELVAMRHAQLVEEGRLEQAEQRAAEKYAGNGGCYALRRKLGLPPGRH